MKQISLPQASILTSPNPVSLICTLKEDQTTNLATVSWYTYLSYHPWMIGFAMSKPSYSGERIRKTHEAILTIPGKELKEIVQLCGSSTGRHVNKVDQYHIPLEKVLNSKIQIPQNSKVIMALNCKEYIEVGDHYLYICEVKDVYANEQRESLFAYQGYVKIDVAK